MRSRDIATSWEQPTRQRLCRAPSARSTGVRSVKIPCTAPTRRTLPRRRSRSFSPATKSSAERRGNRSHSRTVAMEECYQIAFWVAVLKIIWINILLSGDNAVVIAMACRSLPPRERLWGMVIGAGLASILLILFTAVAAKLMTLPYLKLIGSIALLWIAFRLLVPSEADEARVEASESLWRAVKIVVVADIVMSLDNVIAVAAAANGSYILLGLGLAVSIPLVIAGSALIMM